MLQLPGLINRAEQISLARAGLELPVKTAISLPCEIMLYVSSNYKNPSYAFILIQIHYNYIIKEKELEVENMEKACEKSDCQISHFCI